MDWMEVSVPAHGEPEALCQTLGELGVTGCQVEDERDFQSFLEGNTQYWDFVDDKLRDGLRGVSRVKFWLPDDDEGAAMAAELRKLGLSPEVRRVSDADWENNWREYYKPIEVGQSLVIVPEWEASDGGRTPVRLDPGLLFGTGAHATTRLCLEAVERYTAPGARVLDIGCGSGILGIAAAVLGCGSVAAVDIDEKAPDIVRRNAALNGVEDRFEVHVGDAAADGRLRKRLGGGYGLVLANIVADVIIALAPHAPGFLAEGGVFVCSGIIDGRQDEVRAALEAAGLSIAEHETLDEWHCYVCSCFSSSTKHQSSGSPARSASA